MGEIAVPIVFLSRHDRGHQLSPADVTIAQISRYPERVRRYRVFVSALGLQRSFWEELPPGTFVLMDRFVRPRHPRASWFSAPATSHRFHGPSSIARGSAFILPKLRWRKALPLSGTAPMSVSKGRDSPRLPRAWYKNLGYWVIGMTDLQDQSWRVKQRFVRDRCDGELH